MPTVEAEFPALIIDLLAGSGLCKSKSDAKRQIKGGAIKVDYGDGKKPIRDLDAKLQQSAVLWFGKKKCVRVEG